MQRQQGDEQAFKKLGDEWQDRVYNTAVGIVQNEDDADDRWIAEYLPELFL